MTYLAGSVTSLVTDRNTWHTRADQAYDGGAWGVGNLWSTDAHNDPNVWNNRYNAGQASVMPDGSGSTPHVVVASGGSGTSVTLDRIGTWRISIVSNTASVGTGSGGVPQYTTTVGGTAGLAFNQVSFPHPNAPETGLYFGYAGTVTVTSLGLTVNVVNDVGFACVYNPGTYTLTAVFVPTPTYPH